METDKNNTKDVFDTEFAKLPALKDTVTEKTLESKNAREEATVNDTANLLWGVPAVEAVGDDGDDNYVAAVDAVEGVEEKLRKANKAVGAAHKNLSAAENALAKNTDPQNVNDLVNAIRDAGAAVEVKELSATRAQEYFNLLEENYNDLQKTLDDRYKGEDDARVEKETGEL